MSIKIIKPGVQTTLQDEGRFGYRHIGVGSGGAMDVFAMKVSNYLCGNDEKKAVIEMNFPAPEILFQQDAMISLAGADFSATINDAAVPVWQTVLVKKGSILKCKQPLKGAKLYLAVKGGWQAQQWLNSYSTHLKLAAGGHNGMALQKDAVVDFVAAAFTISETKILPWRIAQLGLDKIYRQQNHIRYTNGAEYHWLDALSQQNFTQNNFTISHQSDRMGFRLNGNHLSQQFTGEMISSAVDEGTVQLLPDGNCIVLMADHQTTGGYPRIASVIKADLPQLAQLTPGKSIHFKPVHIKEAEEALISMHETLAEIKNACDFNVKKYLPR